MNSMSHRGCTARVEYDERDHIFVGRILGVHAIISFHGKTVAELRSEFELAVDDYLTECEEQDIAPEKPASGKLLLRVPPDVHGKAVVLAQAAGKSLNQWVTEAIERALDAAGPEVGGVRRLKGRLPRPAEPVTIEQMNPAVTGRRTRVARN